MLTSARFPCIDTSLIAVADVIKLPERDRKALTNDITQTASITSDAIRGSCQVVKKKRKERWKFLSSTAPLARAKKLSSIRTRDICVSLSLNT